MASATFLCMYILIWRWNKNSYDIHGLSADDSDSIVQKHKPPILLKTIDFKNEKEAVYEKIETACIITSSRDVYKCFGTITEYFLILI